MLRKKYNGRISVFFLVKCIKRKCSVVVKDLRLKDKDKDKDLKIGPRGQGFSSRTTTLRKCSIRFSFQRFYYTDTTVAAEIYTFRTHARAIQ